MSVGGDSFRFDISGDGEKLLTASMSIAFMDNDKAIGFHKTSRRLTFFLAEHPESTALPAKLDCKAIMAIVQQWLETEAEYPRQPDHDGDNKRGFRIYNEAWGHIEPFGWQAFMAIEPMWTMYGK